MRKTLSAVLLATTLFLPSAVNADHGYGLPKMNCNLVDLDKLTSEKFGFVNTFSALNMQGSLFQFFTNKATGQWVTVITNAHLKISCFVDKGDSFILNKEPGQGS